MRRVCGTLNYRDRSNQDLQHTGGDRTRRLIHAIDSTPLMLRIAPYYTQNGFRKLLANILIGLEIMVYCGALHGSTKILGHSLVRNKSEARRSLNSHSHLTCNKPCPLCEVPSSEGVDAQRWKTVHTWINQRSTCDTDLA